MAMRSTEDPYYLARPAQWVLRRVMGTGVEVDVMDDLHVPCYSSPEDGHIWIRAGLAFPEFHWLMARSIVHQLFGVQSAPPVLPTGPDAVKVGRNAQVIPFQRPPFSSGDWRS